MDAKPAKIADVFQQETLLRIPYFQRHYVWGEEEWERFANDMASTLDADVKKYFLGALILKEENNADAGIDKYLVIDGQQRLTTLSIYMKVLCMLAEKRDKFSNQFLQDNGPKDPIIIHSYEDIAQYRKIMHLEKLESLDDNSNMAKAYEYFRTVLTTQKPDYLNLYNTIKKVRFIRIILDKDDDEQQIFDTINSLGVPLTTAELMKNFLYEANDEQAYKNDWRPMFDADNVKDFWDAAAASDKQSKSKDNITIERFFHAFVRIKMWDYKDDDKLTPVRKKNFVKLENVFSTCKAFVEVFKMEKQDLAKEIVEYAALFKEHLNPEILDSKIPKSGIERISCLVNATKSYSVIPYVLYILRHVADLQERNRIFDCLEAYLVRRILTGASNNNYSDMFSENLIGSGIKTYAGLKAYYESRGNAATAMPSDNNIKMALQVRPISEASARLVYYLYETKTNTNLDGFSNYYAGLFMPKPGKMADKKWPPLPNKDDEDVRKGFINTLGNYFLFDAEEKTIKKSINQDFTTKLALQKDWSTGINISKNHLDNCKNWDSDAICKRNEILARGICTIWKL